VARILVLRPIRPQAKRNCGLYVGRWFQQQPNRKTNGDYLPVLRLLCPPVINEVLRLESGADPRSNVVSFDSSFDDECTYDTVGARSSCYSRLPAVEWLLLLLGGAQCYCTVRTSATACMPWQFSCLLCARLFLSFQCLDWI
jgi:hypothetical protein